MHAWLKQGGKSKENAPTSSSTQQQTGGAAPTLLGTLSKGPPINKSSNTIQLSKPSWTSTSTSQKVPFPTVVLPPQTSNLPNKRQKTQAQTSDPLALLHSKSLPLGGEGAGNILNSKPQPPPPPPPAAAPKPQIVFCGWEEVEDEDSPKIVVPHASDEEGAETAGAGAAAEEDEESLSSDDEDEGGEETKESDGAAPLDAFLRQLMQMRQEKMRKFVVSSNPMFRHPKAHFQRDPVLLSRAVFNTFSRNQERNLAAPVLAARRCAESFSIQDILLGRVQYSAGELKASTPISIVKFDLPNALFAVGGSNGVVRIFDFDECLMRMTQARGDEKEKPVLPVVSVDTRRAVSDVAWSPDHDDEICVSFSFREEIHVYDLQDLGSPLFALTMPKKVGSVGYNVVKYLPPMQQQLKQHQQQQKQKQASSQRCSIVAGSKSGHVRRWNINAQNNAGSFVWEVTADNGCVGPVPVVALEQVEHRRIISLNQNGLVAVWDLEHMTVPSFGCTSLPSLVSKFDLCSPCVGMSFECTYASDVAPLLGTIYVTFSNGDVKALLFEGLCRLVPRFSFKLGASFAVPLTLLGKETDYLKLSTQLNTTVARPCPAVLPKFLGGRIGCVTKSIAAGSASGLCFFDVGDQLHGLDLIERQRVVDSQQTDRKSSTSAAGAPLGGKFFKVYSEANEAKPCLTLPGHVVSVDHGGTEVVVSKNLESYLCPSSVSASAPTRSHEIFLDWSRSSSSGGGEKMGAAFTISGVQPFALTLSAPYRGPAVENGLPRVHIRTNLAAVEIERCAGAGGSSSTSSKSVEFLSLDKCLVAITKVKREDAQGLEPAAAAVLPAPEEQAARVTAMACHGHLPFIVCGHEDDSISVCAAGTRR